MNEEQEFRDEASRRPADAARAPQDRRRRRRRRRRRAGCWRPRPPTQADQRRSLRVGADEHSATLQTMLASSVDGPAVAGTADGAFRVDAPNADYGVYGTGKSYGVAGLGPGRRARPRHRRRRLQRLGRSRINLDPQGIRVRRQVRRSRATSRSTPIGVLYFCVSGIARANPPFSADVDPGHEPGRCAIVPARLAGARRRHQDGTGGITGPLAPGATVHTTTSLIGVAGIPIHAIGVVGTSTIAGVGGALLNGFGVATIYPAGVATPPTVSNINVGRGLLRHPELRSRSRSGRVGTPASSRSCGWGGGWSERSTPSSTSPATSRPAAQGRFWPRPCGEAPDEAAGQQSLSGSTRHRRPLSPLRSRHETQRRSQPDEDPCHRRSRFRWRRFLCLVVLRHPDWELMALDNLRRRGSEPNLRRLHSAGVRFLHGDVGERQDVAAAGDFGALIEARRSRQCSRTSTSARLPRGDESVGAHNWRRHVQPARRPVRDPRSGQHGLEQQRVRVQRVVMIDERDELSRGEL